MRNDKRIRHRRHGTLGNRALTKYSFTLYDDVASYHDVKLVLDDVEGVSALLKDAVIAYVRSKDFDLERYEGPGHRKSDE